MLQQSEIHLLQGSQEKWNTISIPYFSKTKMSFIYQFLGILFIDIGVK